MEKNKNLNYACLFGGGAIRGICYVGAIKALEELGIQPTTIAGSSVGSIVAALVALGYNSTELKDVFMNINYELFRDIQLGFSQMVALSKGEVFLDWLRELIEKKFYGKNYVKGKNKPVTFDDIENNLVIITTDLANFECQEFSKFETPDYEIASAIRISSCFPGLMKPITYNDRILVDGDLQKSWPMWKLSKHLLNENDRILELRLEGDYNGSTDGINGLSYANAVYSCMTAMSTSFITNIYANKDKFDYLVLNTGDIIVVDFNISKEKRENLVALGYDQTMKYFKDFLPAKKSKILENYSIIQGHLLKIRGFMKVKNYGKVKTEIGELFINLSELFQIIDLYHYREIKKFKDDFLSNCVFGLLGSKKLKNEQLIYANLKTLCNSVDDKVEELLWYIDKYSK